MTVPTLRTPRLAFQPLPSLQDSLSSPFTTPSLPSTPPQPCQNSLQLEMPLEYGVASSSKAVFIPKRPYWGIIALPDDPMEDQDDLDMFQWPPMDRPPRGSSPSLPQNLLGLETDHGLRELHDFLDELEPSHFEPRMSSVEVPIDGLSIAYCGDQTTFTNTKKWSRLTIYHIGDASREATRSKALEAIGLGATDLEC